MSAPSALKNRRVAFVGLGKMASFMLRPLLKSEALLPSQVIATRSSSKGIEEIRKSFPDIATTKDNEEACADADFIIWGTKPQDFKEIAKPLRGKLRDDSLLVSIMGGVTMSSLAEGFKHENVARCMPNVPVDIGRGVVPWVIAPCVKKETCDELDVMFTLMGNSVPLKKEMQIDMATAISGSSPAYFLLFLEALVEGGVHIGLSRDVAFELARQSMLGTAEMIKDADTLATQKYSVTSPGGITASALYQAERSALRHTVSSIVWAAYRRTLEISADGPKTVYGPGVWMPREIE